MLLTQCFLCGALNVNVETTPHHTPRHTDTTQTPRRHHADTHNTTHTNRTHKQLTTQHHVSASSAKCHKVCAGIHGQIVSAERAFHQSTNGLRRTRLGNQGESELCVRRRSTERVITVILLAKRKRELTKEREREIDGEHPEGLPCVEGWWALVALIASMASMACGHKGALTWKSPWWRRVASNGDEWRRRWVAGVLTQRALTWKSLYTNVLPCFFFCGSKFLDS